MSNLQQCWKYKIHINVDLKLWPPDVTYYFVILVFQHLFKIFKVLLTCGMLSRSIKLNFSTIGLAKINIMALLTHTTYTYVYGFYSYEYYSIDIYSFVKGSQKFNFYFWSYDIDLLVLWHLVLRHLVLWHLVLRHMLYWHLLS